MLPGTAMNGSSPAELPATSSGQQAAPVGDTRARVLVFNDHPVFKSALSWKLGPESGIEVMADTVALSETIHAVSELSAEAVVADLRIGDGNSEGVASVQTLASRFEGTPVIVCTDFHFRSYVTKLLKAGAAAVLPKSAPVEQLAEAIIAAIQDTDAIAATPHESNGSAA